MAERLAYVRCQRALYKYSFTLHPEPECHKARRLAFSFQCQCHCEGLCNQHVAVVSMCTKLLIINVATKRATGSVHQEPDSNGRARDDLQPFPSTQTFSRSVPQYSDLQPFPSTQT